MLNPKVIAYLLKYGFILKRYRHRLFPRFQGREVLLSSRMLLSGSRVELNIGDFSQYWMFMEKAYEKQIVRFMRRVAARKVLLEWARTSGTTP